MIRSVAWSLLAAVLMLGTGIGKANAAFTTFFDKSEFLTATGAIKATAPYLGGYGNNLVSGSITFSQGYRASTIWLGNDSTPLLPGNDLGLSEYESLNVKPKTQVFALGFDFFEPNGGADSTFNVKIKSKNIEVGDFNFNAPNNVAYFVGVQSDIAFDYMQIVEIIGGIENEWYGQFYSATELLVPSVPEPASVALLGLGLTGLTIVSRRRRT